MKKFLQYLMVAALLAGCGDSTDSGTGDDGKDGDVTKPDSQGGGETEGTTCETMSCPNGCCDGKCVDLRSEPKYCGRCDSNCGDQFCLNGKCTQTCDGGRICDGACVDLKSNDLHCGKCNQACGPNMQCTDKGCVCKDGFADCDGKSSNGCESEGASCECIPDETRECYTFDEKTKNVGECKAGVQTCGADAMWGECMGEVGPRDVYECTKKDYNCNGMPDGDEDRDGDGYSICQGDCCDRSDLCHVKVDCPAGMTCNVGDPKMINPGAWDDPENHIDDDCNETVDDGKGDGGGVLESCSDVAKTFAKDTKLTATDAELLAKAMDICTGLVSAHLLLADGSELPAKGNKSVCGNKTTVISPSQQAAVMASLGDIVKPVGNATMAALSSGKAQGKENTGYQDCSGTEVKAPAAFLSQHGGVLPASSVCESSREDTKANDSMMLRLKLKAPATAKGFSFQFKFFSKEYPNFVCDKYNDFFLAMVDGKGEGITKILQDHKDHNVAFDTNGDPVSVNNAFFTECDATACKKDKGCSTCKDGTEQLAGYFTKTKEAGATGWLQTSVPVSANEEFTLDLIIFDAGERANSTSTTDGFGHLRDSLVLIDKFQWRSESTSLETVPIVN